MQYLTTKIIETYQSLVKQKSKELNRILLIINVVFIVAIGISLYVALTTNLSFLVPIVIAGVSASLILVSVLIAQYYVNEKPLYEFLYPKLVDDLQFEETYTLRYEAYPKIKEALKASKLFSRFASNTTRAGFYFIDDASHQVSLFDSYYFTTTNNSVEIHFNGYYIMVEGIIADPIQIRTKGKPHHKEISYTKITHEKQLKIYQSNVNAASNTYIKSIYDLFLSKLRPQHLFVSVDGSTLFVALDYKKPLRKIKTLDKENYQALKKQLTSIIDTINLASELKP